MALAAVFQLPRGAAAPAMLRPGNVDERSNKMSGWTALLQRVAGGDDHALSQLYDEASPLVYGVVRRVVWDESDAEDVTAEVFTQVWSRAGAYDEKLGSPAAWILTIARNRAVDRLRRRRRQGRAVSIDDAGDLVSPENVEEGISLERRGARVRRAMGGLTAEQRVAIELAFFSGLSHTDIAHRLGLPVGTIKTRIRLGMNKLRAALGGRESEEHGEAEGV